MAAPAGGRDVIRHEIIATGGVNDSKKKKKKDHWQVFEASPSIRNDHII